MILVDNAIRHSLPMAGRRQGAGHGDGAALVVEDDGPDPA
jgi:hypothetical protein